MLLYFGKSCTGRVAWPGLRILSGGGGGGGVGASSRKRVRKRSKVFLRTAS